MPKRRRLRLAAARRSTLSNFGCDDAAGLHQAYQFLLHASAPRAYVGVKARIGGLHAQGIARRGVLHSLGKQQNGLGAVGVAGVDVERHIALNKEVYAALASRFEVGDDPCVVIDEVLAQVGFF